MSAVTLAAGSAGDSLPWIAVSAVFVGAAALVWHRLPAEPIAWWFGVAGGLVALIQAADSLLAHVAATGGPAGVAWAAVAFQLTLAVGIVALVHLIGLFPDGHTHTRLERRVLAWLWALPVLPVVAFVSHPTVLLPSYHPGADVANPYAFVGLGPLGAVAAAGVTAAQGVFAVGVVLLVTRYRRSGEPQRRRIRWLLLPTLLAGVVAVVDVAAWQLFQGGAPNVTLEVALTALWIPAVASLPLAMAIGLLRPGLADVDWVLRKSLVHAVLGSLIVVAYVGMAAGLGLAAGRLLPLGLAVALAVAAALAFHPARQRLERVADRWVFGPGTDSTRLISRLGAALEDTVELEALLPRMADTLREGLGLAWARVRLEPAPLVDGEQPPLTVPIVLDGERLGVVECGPKRSGTLTADEEAMVATLARQAALAVRNVRLTAELEASRLRLVRAQDAERRRIERNIHDGAQQDLVALVGAAAHARAELARDPASGERALDELQQGLRQVIAELRELAHGIHPSLLSDRGLLEAVEALAGRSRVPVSVRADPALRGARLSEDVEGAGYFTVAEALANVSKHANASQAEVSLARADGSLEITVADDGGGFDPAAATSEGLANLGERLAALGGHLDVASRPGGGTTVSARVQVADG